MPNRKKGANSRPAKSRRGEGVRSSKRAASGSAGSGMGLYMGPQVTIAHDEIRRWVEERDGLPATVKPTGRPGEAGILRIDFPDVAEPSLEVISWNEFFQKFEEKNLEFAYQERTPSGQLSRFNKFINRGSTAQIRGGPAPPKTRAAGSSGIFEG